MSYGSYQLATKWERPQEFLANEGQAYAEEFEGLEPGSPEFSDVWRRIAAEDPEGFEQQQFDFIRRTHYEPQVNRIYDLTGVDVSRSSDALQDAVWSSSVQHGPGTPAVVAAIRGVRSSSPDLSPGTREFDAAVLRAIYSERGRRVARNSAIGPALQRGIAGRYLQEEAEAMRMLDEQFPTASGAPQ